MSEADVRRSIGAVEDEWVMTCPACGSEQRAAECVMGTLGNLVHCRCRHCATDFSLKRRRPRVEDVDPGDDDLGPLDLPLPGDIGDEEGHVDYNQAVLHDLDHCRRCHGEIDADELENNDGICDECATNTAEEDGLAAQVADDVDETERALAQPDEDGDEKIILHDIEGMARKSGTDDDGNKWVQFEVDAFAEQEPGECSICGDELESGWMCLDGGEEVCDKHVDLEGGVE